MLASLARNICLQSCCGESVGVQIASVVLAPPYPDPQTLTPTLELGLGVKRQELRVHTDRVSVLQRVVVSRALKGFSVH